MISSLHEGGTFSSQGARCDPRRTEAGPGTQDDP